MHLSRRSLLGYASAAAAMLTLPGSRQVMALTTTPRQALTDSGPWLRDQIANANGYLQLAPGVYSIGVVPHSRNPKYLAGFFLPSGFKLCGSGRGNTIIQLLPGQPNHAFLGLNEGFDLGGDQYISVEDLCFDGNASQQGTLDAQVGLSFWGACSISLRHLLFKNVYGSTRGTNGPLGTNGEGTHCDFTTSTHCTVEDCEVNGGPMTSTGFSTTSCTDVKYVNSVACNMQFSQGFTGYQSTGLSYASCTSVLNGYNGFNAEICNDIRYLGCLAGGAAGAYGVDTLYPLGQSLGNGQRGINIKQSTQVQIEACTCSHNASHGIQVYSGASGVRIVGGQMQSNTGWGVYTDSSVTDALLVGSPKITGNTAGQSTI